jgi:hypothetical protein
MPKQPAAMFWTHRIQPSLQSVSFDTTGYSLQAEPVSPRVWFTPDGDGLGLYFFAKQPDIPSTDKLGDLGSYYAAQVRPLGGVVLETSLLRVDGCAAVKTIVKLPQPQLGFVYVASITIPFREFSFVFEVQCGEHGVTGVREALLVDRQLATTSESFDPDHERFDLEFPSHPVSRACRVMVHVATTARLDQATKDLPKFAGLSEL